MLIQPYTSLTRLNLKEKPTIQVLDEHPNSRFFRITGIENKDYGLGRHSFHLLGSDLLVHGSYVYIEILDSYNQPIITRGIPSDVIIPGWRIWFHVRKDHEPGIATIYIAGSATHTPDGRKLTVGQKWGGDVNVLWSHDIMVNPKLVNRSPIVFMDTPDLSVTEDETQTVEENAAQMSFVNFAIRDIEPYSGQVAKIEIYAKNNSITSGSYNLINTYPLLSSSFTKNGVNPDSANFQKNILLTHLPTLYDFKAVFKNPIDETAKDSSGDTLEVFDTNNSLYGISNVISASAGNIDLEVEEIISTGDSGQEWQPSSIANLNISNIVVSAGNVLAIVAEKHKSALPPSASNWNACGMFKTGKWTGSTDSHNFTASIGGIETRKPSDGGLNWDFRVGFINSNNTFGTLLPAISGSSGSVAANVFTFQTNPSLTDSTLQGRIASFSSSAQTTDTVFDYESPHEYYYVSNNTSNTVTLQALQSGGTVPTNANTYLYLDTNYITDIQTNFDGFSDLGECLEVSGLKAYINSAWKDATTGDIIGTKKIRLLWHNMYSSSVTSATGADGNIYTGLTKEKWNNTNTYRIYMWLNNSGETEPQYEYPSLNDASGSWYFAEEVKAVKSTTPTFISASIDSLPAGSYVSFWVGAMTRYGISVADANPRGKGYDTI